MELNRVPESTPCIALQGGLGERKEAEEKHAQLFRPEILPVLAGTGAFHELFQETGSDVFTLWGHDILMGGAKSTCPGRVRGSLRKIPGCVGTLPVLWCFLIS